MARPKAVSIPQSCQDKAKPLDRAVTAAKKIRSNRYRLCVTRPIAVLNTSNFISQDLPRGERPTQRPSSRQKTIAYAARKQVAFGIERNHTSLDFRNKTKSLVMATRLGFILTASRTMAMKINRLHLRLRPHPHRRHPSRHRRPSRHHPLRRLRLHLRPHRRRHRPLPIRLLRRRPPSFWPSCA